MHTVTYGADTYIHTHTHIHGLIDSRLPWQEQLLQSSIFNSTRFNSLAWMCMCARLLTTMNHTFVHCQSGQDFVLLFCYFQTRQYGHGTNIGACQKTSYLFIINWRSIYELLWTVAIVVAVVVTYMLRERKATSSSEADLVSKLIVVVAKEGNQNKWGEREREERDWLGHHTTAPICMCCLHGWPGLPIDLPLLLCCWWWCWWCHCFVRARVHCRGNQWSERKAEKRRSDLKRSSREAATA